MRTLPRLFFAVMLAAGCAHSKPQHVVMGAAECDLSPPAPKTVYFEDKPDQVWVHGRWARVADQWVWQDGWYQPARTGAVWANGHWDHKGGQYVWIDGQWRTAREGFVYIPGYWGKRNGTYVWISDRWEPQREGETYVPGHWAVVNGSQEWTDGAWKDVATGLALSAR